MLDATRLAALSQHVPGPLAGRIERWLRQRAGAISVLAADADSGAISSFVAFVLEEVCGLDASTGAWSRGSNVSPSWGRRAITGETVKPRHLWTGRDDARLPVFLDDGRRLGVGRGRRIVSQVLGWLRAGNDHLALVTNGRQWRLLFAGLDYDAWCEWDLDLWFEEGELSPQVAALRTLLNPALWTPETEDAAPPLLQAIRDTRKGQAELSEVLGERVREAVEILIRGHGEALSVLARGPEAADVTAYHAYPVSGGLRGILSAGTSSVEAPFGDDEHHAHRGTALEDQVSAVEIPFDDDEPSPGVTGVTPQDIYRAACRVAMRLVVILFAESRELLPRDNALYHESYGLNGLLERLERAGARGGGLARGLQRLAPRAGALQARAGRLPSPRSAGDRLRRRPVRARSPRHGGRPLPSPVRLRECLLRRRHAAGPRCPRDAEAPHPHHRAHPPGPGRHEGGGAGGLLRPLLRVHRHPLRGTAGLRAEDRAVRRSRDLPLGGRPAGPAPLASRGDGGPGAQDAVRALEGERVGGRCGPGGRRGGRAFR